MFGPPPAPHRVSGIHLTFRPETQRILLLVHVLGGSEVALTLRWPERGSKFYLPGGAKAASLIPGRCGAFLRHRQLKPSTADGAAPAKGWERVAAGNILSSFRAEGKLGKMLEFPFGTGLTSVPIWHTRDLRGEMR